MQRRKFSREFKVEAVIRHPLTLAECEVGSQTALTASDRKRYP